jgi:release factor glutamine methyltransferase
LAAATGALRGAGVASAAVDAELLAAYALGVPRSRLPVLGVAPPEAVRRFDDLIRRRCERVPLQHLTGSAGFRHLVLEVGPGVFVPRPETEVVAGFVIDFLRSDRKRCDHGFSAHVVVDLCTGSGAIALSVAHEVPGSRVYAVDVDETALTWAHRNVVGTGAAVTLCRADVGHRG